MSAWLRLTLIMMTVGGGFTGVALTLQLMQRVASRPDEMAVAAAFLLAHIFILISGLMFVENPNRMKPLVIALAIQILAISSPMVTYWVMDGICLSGGVLANRLTGNLFMGSQCRLQLFQASPWGVGVNVVPVVLLVAMRKSISRTQQQKKAESTVDGWTQ